MSRLRRWTPLLAACVFLASTALAQETGDAPKPPPGPCARDAKTLCPGLEPGDGKFESCMKRQAQAGKLSKDCKNLVDGIFSLSGQDQGDDEDNDAASEEPERGPEPKLKGPPPAPPKLSPACRAKIAKVCPGLKPGGGKFAGCLKAHRRELAACPKPPPPPPPDDDNDEGD